MHKYIVSILIVLLLFFSTGCASKKDTPFSEYPPISEGKGQLVIFSVLPENSKISFAGEVECNKVLCAKVIDYRGHGLYSIYSVTPKEVAIKAPGRKFIIFAGNVELSSNELKVNIEPGKRTIVRITLLRGSEFVSPASGQVGNASQEYRIEVVSEAAALSKIQDLRELKLRDTDF